MWKQQLPYNCLDLYMINTPYVKKTLLNNPNQCIVVGNSHCYPIALISSLSVWIDHVSPSTSLAQSSPEGTTVTLDASKCKETEIMYFRREVRQVMGCSTERGQESDFISNWDQIWDKLKVRGLVNRFGFLVFFLIKFLHKLYWRARFRHVFWKIK